MVWLKALHVMAVVTFAAGLLLGSLLLALQHAAPLPRLPQERRLLVAARKWDRFVTTPALALVWLLGVSLAVQMGWFGTPWLTGKLMLVTALSALHAVQAGLMRRLVSSPTSPPAWTRSTFVPALLALGASVLLVMLKPG